MRNLIVIYRIKRNIKNVHINWFISMGKKQKLFRYKQLDTETWL